MTSPFLDRSTPLTTAVLWIGFLALAAVGGIAGNLLGLPWHRGWTMAGSAASAMFFVFVAICGSILIDVAKARLRTRYRMLKER